MRGYRGLGRTGKRLIAGGVFCSHACTLTAAAASSGPRLPPMVPPNLDEAQQKLYDNIVDTRIKIVGREALFDENGGLRGPWNPEVASPALGTSAVPLPVEL